MPEMLYDLSGKRVWVAGDRGMVGSAIVRRLAEEPCQVILAPRTKVDLTRQDQTETWMSQAQPQVVIVAAARVGGIHANNTRPAEFIYDNLMIEANVVHAARRMGVEKLLLLGSSCIYPRLAPQPIQEEALLSGPLEPTNEWYAVAKIAGIKLCQAYRRQYGSDFITAMPTNIYGPGDNFDPLGSHVAAALLRKAHLAKSEGARHLDVWGTGQPRREFLHVDDLADAVVRLVTHYSSEMPINVGTGDDLTIKELAELVCEVVGFTGAIRFDPSKPDGTPRKLLDVSRMRALGWEPRIDLREGFRRTYDWFLRNPGDIRTPEHAAA
ncbi:GDP-L-fucose synthase [Thalassobaculum sp.]|uniref:GDP-L-fucose synthase n=1 Tax=Thalassobaculum sp. TaxID=2022740 RepID=UPI0032EE1152